MSTLFFYLGKLYSFPVYAFISFVENFHEGMNSYPPFLDKKDVPLPFPAALWAVIFILILLFKSIILSIFQRYFGV